MASAPETPLILDAFRPFHDSRGSFQKIYRLDHLAQIGVDETFRECFISFSEPGVIRGMHFQLPPADHWKLVSCIAGEIQDVCVDLHAGANYGTIHSFHFSHANGHSLLIPPGFAHGFIARGKIPAGVLYLTSTEHAPDLDRGIRWDSIGFDWGTKAPQMSDRDLRFPSLQEFKTSFQEKK